MFLQEKASQRNPLLLDPAKSHLLIIDQQTGFAPAIPGLETIAARSAILLQAAKILDIPVAVTEQYPKALGPTVPALKSHLTEDMPVLEKLCFSAMDDLEFTEVVREERRSQFILCGVETHVCILQTAFDLMENLGAQLIVVGDAVGSRKESDKSAALARLAQAGAQIATVEMVVFEWLRKAGTPEFKALQALVK